jgi:hypothetical protein
MRFFTLSAVRAALAALVVAMLAPASNALTFTPTFTDFNSQIIGAAIDFNSTDTWEITNDTGATWQSFAIETSPRGVSFSKYMGPGFAIAFTGSLTIGGISIADGGVLTFTVDNSSNGTRTFSGTPSTDAIANPVPLPAAAWLLLSGLGALGALSRRKRAA